MNENNVAMQKKQSEAAELKALTDKFLLEHGVAKEDQDEKKWNVKVSDLNILIAVPAYSGELKYKMVPSLLSLTKKLTDLGIRHRVEVMPGLVQIVRDYFANKCAFDMDQDCLPYSSLLFIDADSGNYENGVLKLIMENKLIAGLLYSTKDVAWQRVAHVVRSGAVCSVEDTQHLREYAGIPDINAERPFSVNSLSPIRHIGCGTLLIQKKVFLDLADAHPEWRYHVYGASYYFGPTAGREWNYAFFQVQIDPETRHMVSEDFFFADAARKLGHESFVLASERTFHTGEYGFIMNLPLIASHPMAQFS